MISSDPETQPLNQTNVYRTGSGTIFRVSQDPEGHFTVETLKSGVWQTGSIGMVGLRIAHGTRQLTPRQVEALKLAKASSA
jgi:hypothetical protein